MLEYIENEANMTRTENGAAAYGSTGSDCLDLFSSVGALRRESADEIIKRFARAYAEDPDTAMKILFFARDVRGGLGERRVFRVILKWLAANEPESVIKNLGHVAEFGRWDDLLTLIDTPCWKEALEVIERQLSEDVAAAKAGAEVSLLAKWLPSVNASSPETKRLAKKVARALGLTEEAYRKALTALRARIKLIENDLRVKDYTFDYEKQPSRAMFKYKKAFLRNDGERYGAFLEAVSSGKATLRAGNVAPYELVAPYLSCIRYNECFMKDVTPEEKDVLNATWASMPDFGGSGNALAVVDTSGSMYCPASPLPAAVALSLGLYFAEHNKGAFKNSFIEFSERPQLIKLKGRTFADRLRYAASFNEVANTDIGAVFDVILAAAVKNGVPQDELPEKLIIISDMEFDVCVDNADATNFENAKRKYEAHGYKLPEVVFWDVACRNPRQPVRQNERGVALVSGTTPRLFAMIAGGVVSPRAFMLETLANERYAKISA